ncbi:hypothetical protein [Chitinophaga sp. XS-30]|uniref:hypothetical protein n=1 Tax=Chitinophaga sp. XS-30 TaxID=2604421 RepID=UPI0011DCFEF9|nr:hypothetical protein [Chitinophaga sp. XS-30]QEH39437.1 hypothetical protein FW415_00530 [Chitinophaga sp. XS-30]
MKSTPILLLLTALAACSAGNNKQQKFAGTYIRVMETEFNTLYDTIRIEQADASTPLVYTLSNRGRVVPKGTDDQAAADRKTSKQRTGTYDEATNTLTVEGVPFILNAKDELTNGQITYTRCTDCR